MSSSTVDGDKTGDKGRQSSPISRGTAMKLPSRHKSMKMLMLAGSTCQADCPNRCRHQSHSTCGSNPARIAPVDEQTNRDMVILLGIDRVWTAEVHPQSRDPSDAERVR